MDLFTLSHQGKGDFCTFTNPCQPIKGEGAVVLLTDVFPENEKALP